MTLNKNRVGEEANVNGVEVGGLFLASEMVCH